MVKAIFISLLSVIFITGSGMCEETRTMERSFTIESEELSIIVDIDAGEYKVVSSGEGDVCRIRVEYEYDNCDVEIDFNDRKNELEVIVDHEDLIRNKSKNNHRDMAIIIIELPSDPVIEMRSKIKAGEVDFQLGDISLCKFSLRSWAGETTIDFDSPNRTTLESFDVHCSIGETTLTNLGNARIEEADINNGIGELKIDFNGDFRDDMYANIDLDIGETDITLPGNVGIKMDVSKFILSEVNIPDSFNKRRGDYYSEDYDDAAIKLDLDISSGLGELDIHVE